MSEPPQDRKSAPRLIGDFLREAAVLIIVFYPLDRYLRLQDRPEDATKIVPVHQVILISLLLLTIGILLEIVDFKRLFVRFVNWMIVSFVRLRYRLARR